MLRRLLLLAGCFLFLAFAAYGSFVPFRFERLTFAQAWARFPPPSFDRHGSRTDFIANVLLFVPVGLTLAGALADRSRIAAVLAIPAVAVVAFAASVGIEFGQVFVQTRTASWNDIVAETAGAVIGACAWLLLARPVHRWLRPLIEPADPVERAIRLLSLYVVPWVVLHLLPLDFTLRPSELAEKYRAGRIVLVPFADLHGWMNGISDVVSTALQASPVGALCRLLLADRLGRSAAARWAMLLGIAGICALEIAQLLAFSRSADTTDILAGTVGVAAGVWAAGSWLANSPGDVERAVSNRRVRPWALGALVAWIVVLLVRHWSPFDFVFSGAMYRSRSTHLVELPFRHYYWANYLDALSEATTKTLLGVPVGVLLQVFWPMPASRGGRWAQSAVFVACAGCLFTVIELGQVFLPSRGPDITDILLGVSGAVGGFVGMRLLAGARLDAHEGDRQEGSRRRSS